jgi:hypothetical protein
MRTIQLLHRILFGLIVLLWLKCLWDIAHAHEVFQNARFPLWFTILFFTAGIAIAPLFWWCTTNLKTQQKPFSTKNIWLWLSIPIALVCVSPVCYHDMILIACYPISNIQRWMLLLAPIILGFIYFKDNQKLAITILLIIGILALFPNDGCNNQFNYWYVKRIGFSPLTYVPVVLNILFVSSAYFGKNKNILILLSVGVSIGSLIISFGHRFHLLW